MNHIRTFGNSAFASLSIPNYRLYFFGQAISYTGTWMQIIAQGLLVLNLTDSGTMLGFVLALQFLPTLLFGPIAGVITDRYPKRKILFFTQSIPGILSILLGILLLFGLVKIWMVYIFAILLGLNVAVDNPTRHAFITEMVGKDLIKNAIALNLSEINLARIIGPALAGIFIASAGIATCFLFNGFSYIAVLIVLSLMNEKELHSPPNTQRINGQLMEGFRYIKSSPILRNTLLMIAIMGTLSYEFVVTLPLLAKFTFHEPTTGYAALMSAMGVGAIIGGLFSASKHTTNFQKLIFTATLFGISILIVSLTPTLLFAITGMIIVGFFSVNFMSIANTILQTESEPGMRGRVMSLWTVAFLGSTPIGGPLMGWIGEHAGPRFALAIGGLAALTAASLGTLLLKKRNKQTPIKLATNEIAVQVDMLNKQ